MLASELGDGAAPASCSGDLCGRDDGARACGAILDGGGSDREICGEGRGVRGVRVIRQADGGGMRTAGGTGADSGIEVGASVNEEGAADTSEKRVGGGAGALGWSLRRSLGWSLGWISGGLWVWLAASRVHGLRFAQIPVVLLHGACGGGLQC